MDIQSLSAQQLNNVKKQLDEEIEHLTSSHSKLRAAQSKFLACVTAINRGVNDGSHDGRAALVPLTASLYVPATLASEGKVLVDVGTGFYIEKSATDAEAFYKRKGDDLAKNMKEVEKIMQNKSGNLRAVEEVLRQKIIENQQAGNS